MRYGFYIDEVALPHKPIPLAVMLVAEQAIHASWQRLKAKRIPNFDLATAKEDEVTLQLYKVLYDEVFDKELVAGFDDLHFTIGTRESKVPNYDGRKPDLMPDLLMAVKGRADVFLRTQDWLFIECKPVDANHTVGVHYGAKGIARFIRGDYAWAMTSALMVAYCADGYTIQSKLSDSLEKRKKEFDVIQMPQFCDHSMAICPNTPAYITQHGRAFKYVETGQQAPPIILRHLWLERNLATSGGKEGGL